MSDRARRPVLSWLSGLCILLLSVAGMGTWMGARSLHSTYVPYLGWRWAGYYGSSFVDLAEGSRYFFGTLFAVLLAGLWMIVPTFRRAKLDPAPAWVPFAVGGLGVVVLVRWYRHWHELDAQYRADVGTAIMVEALPPVLLAAVTTLLLLVILGPLYAWRGRSQPMPPPPPPLP